MLTYHENRKNGSYSVTELQKISYYSEPGAFALFFEFRGEILVSKLILPPQAYLPQYEWGWGLIYFNGKRKDGSLLWGGQIFNICIRGQVTGRQKSRKIQNFHFLRFLFLRLNTSKIRHNVSIFL